MKKMRAEVNMSNEDLKSKVFRLIKLALLLAAVYGLGAYKGARNAERRIAESFAQAVVLRDTIPPDYPRGPREVHEKFGKAESCQMTGFTQQVFGTPTILKLEVRRRGVLHKEHLQLMRFDWRVVRGAFYGQSQY